MKKIALYIFTVYVLCLSLSFDGNYALALKNNVLITSAYNAVSKLEPKPQGQYNGMVIPFKRVGNLIMVEAKVDGQVGYFVLDTGAPYLVLNSTYFRDYPQLQLYASVGATGVNTQSFKTKVDSFSIHHLKYENLQADVTDLSEIENIRKIKVFGLLGTGLFKQLVLNINYQEQQIQFFDPKMTGIPEGSKKFTFKLRNNIMSLKGDVKGETLQLVIDSGAELNAISSSLNPNVDALFRIDNRKRLGGVGEAVEVFTGVFKELKIEEESFINMKTLMIDLEPLSFAYGFKVDGILGYEWLSKKKNVTLHFPEKEIYFYD